MNIDRRTFLASAIATAGLAAYSRSRFLFPVFASTSPEVLAADPRRPQFHLLPAANWMNDPNGPIYWNGKYHMFYQYNPNGAFWGDMHWGHAVSSDMVHWKHLPVALAPTPGGPDTDGCFTGTAVVQDGRVVVIYTAVRKVPENQATIRDGTNSLRETQCLATANDSELKTWTKLPAPVIDAPPAGMQVSGFRDPSPWRQGDYWYMVVGSGVPHKSGAVLLYKSKDLRHWEYLHIVAQGEGSGVDTPNPVDSGDMWECPDLFPLGDRHVLIYSAQGKASWQSGVLDQKTMLFHAEQKGVLDYGSFYAPKTQLDKSGNRILWGWVPETRKLEEYKPSGWAGMFSLPRVLTLGNDGRLAVTFAPEVDVLRKHEQSLDIAADEAENQLRLAKMPIEGCCGEILCEVTPGTAPFNLSLVDSNLPDAQSIPFISMDYAPHDAGVLTIDGKKLTMTLSGNRPIGIQMFIDGSVIEVIANHEIAYTKRFYYPGNSERNVQVKWTGKTSSIKSLSVRQMSPISADRLTT